MPDGPVPASGEPDRRLQSVTHTHLAVNPVPPGNGEVTSQTLLSDPRTPRARAPTEASRPTTQRPRPRIVPLQVPLTMRVAWCRLRPGLL